LVSQLLSNCKDGDDLHQLEGFAKGFVPQEGGNPLNVWIKVLRDDGIVKLQFIPEGRDKLGYGGFKVVYPAHCFNFETKPSRFLNEPSQYARKDSYFPGAFFKAKNISKPGQPKAPHRLVEKGSNFHSKWWEQLISDQQKGYAIGSNTNINIGRNEEGTLYTEGLISDFDLAASQYGRTSLRIESYYVRDPYNSLAGIYTPVTDLYALALMLCEVAIPHLHWWQFQRARDLLLDENLQPQEVYKGITSYSYWENLSEGQKQAWTVFCSATSLSKSFMMHSDLYENTDPSHELICQVAKELSTEGLMAFILSAIKTCQAEQQEKKHSFNDRSDELKARKIEAVLSYERALPSLPGVVAKTLQTVLES
jgi:hypothetical protein